MRSLAILFSAACLLSVTDLQAQCKADSVFTYIAIGGSNSISTIEYFTFDENDSIVKKSLVEMQDGIAVPVYEIGISHFKSGSNRAVSYETRNWIQARGIYRADSKHTQFINKKGLLVAEKYDEIGAEVTPESETNYTYNKTGQLTVNEFRQWSDQSKSWQNKSRVEYFYNGTLQTKSITYYWDSIQNNWAGDWKMIFTYDSVNVLSETVSYQFKNGAWIPRTRTVYGTEPGKPVKWNIVQQWNGSKENWVNQFYYIFQLNDTGYTQKEIHLEWIEKEWKISMTFQYVYNDAGMLVQIQNESGQTIVDRFCRN